MLSTRSSVQIPWYGEAESKELKKKSTLVHSRFICNNQKLETTKIQGHYAEWKKAILKVHILYDYTYMTFLKWQDYNDREQLRHSMNIYLECCGGYMNLYCERNIHILCVYILHILICVYIIYVCVSMLTSWLYNWTMLSKEKEGRRKTDQAVQKMCKIQERRIIDEISYWRNQRGISSRAQINEGKTLPETHEKKSDKMEKGYKNKNTK